MSNCKNGVCAIDSTFKPRAARNAAQTTKLNSVVQEIELKLALAKLDRADRDSQSSQSTRLCLSAIVASALVLVLAIASKADELKPQALHNDVMLEIKASAGFPAIQRLQRAKSNAVNEFTRRQHIALDAQCLSAKAGKLLKK